MRYAIFVGLLLTAFGASAQNIGGVPVSQDSIDATQMIMQQRDDAQRQAANLSVALALAQQQAKRREQEWQAYVKPLLEPKGAK